MPVHTLSHSQVAAGGDHVLPDWVSAGQSTGCVPQPPQDEMGTGVGVTLCFSTLRHPDVLGGRCSPQPFNLRDLRGFAVILTMPFSDFKRLQVAERTDPVVS